jgi:catalase-peroxidase
MSTFYLLFLFVLITNSKINYEDVISDIKYYLTCKNSCPELPGGDDGNRGPRLIRLAWHCSGTYRVTDGRGGCDGAEIRFDPELNWADNAGQRGALRILQIIKNKYGDELTWADLIILAGNIVIESMGGPKIPLCTGRDDRAKSIDGPKLATNSITSETFLIYVNPEVDKSA